MPDKFESSQDFFKCIGYVFLKIVWLLENAPNSSSIKPISLIDKTISLKVQKLFSSMRP